MALSSELISQLVKAAKPVEKKPTEATVYGTVVDQDGGTFVQLDGSDVLTPVSSTVKIKPGERVIVSIKNHTATVTGNLTVQAARGDDVKDIIDEITEVEILIADKVSTEEFDAVNGRIESLIAEDVLIRGSLSAVEATIGGLEADNVVINEKLTANEAAIENLEATSLTADIADLKYASIEDMEAVNAFIYNLDAMYATIEDLNAARADIDDLEVNKLSAEQANLLYANIDFANISEAAIENFFSKSGMIDDLVMSEGKVTGTLVGVTIIGDLIKGGTIQADKLVIKGEDGLYYKLNLEGGATTSEQVTAEDLQNGLSGSIIVAKSITAEKVAVDDLVAFGATIGGFHITDTSLYSGAKASVGNTTRGIYQDTDGQFAVGDASNFLKFYKDTDGKYKLAVSASSMTFSATGKNVEETIQDEVDKVEVGGRNLLTNSSFAENLNNWTSSGVTLTEFDGEACAHIEGVLATTYSTNQNVFAKIDVKDLTQEYTFSADINLQNYVPGTTNPYVKLYLSGQYDKNGTATWMGATTVSGTPECSEYNNQGWVRMTWVVRFDKTPISMLLFMYARDFTGDLYFKNLKLEKGNKATDWTPAPEDVDEAIIDATDSVREAMVEQDTAIITTCEEMILSAGEKYVETGDYEEFRQTVEAQLSVMADEISMNFTSTTESINNVDGELQSFLTTFSKYIKFTGDTAITIGSGDSAITLEIDNETGIVFKKNGAQFGWWDGNEFHTGNIVVEVNERAQLGNFAFIPRSDGSLSFLKVGE